MATNPAHYGTLTFMDYSGEKSTCSFNFDAVTVLNIVQHLVDFGALRAAIDAITAGTLVQDMWVGDRTKFSNVAPTDENAQRELKFLVSYEDDATLNIGRMEVPTPDLSIADILLPGTDLANLAEPTIATFVTAYELFARSNDGNSITVTEIRVVGRSI